MADLKKNLFSFGDISDVATIISNLAARFSTSAQIEQLETFYAGKESEFGSKTIATAITDAKFNLQWADKHVPTIYNYMRSVSSAPQMWTISLSVLLASVALNLIWN